MASPVPRRRNLKDDSRKISAVLRSGWGRKTQVAADQEGWLEQGLLQRECGLGQEELLAALGKGGHRFESCSVLGCTWWRAVPGTFLPKASSGSAMAERARVGDRDHGFPKQPWDAGVSALEETFFEKVD